MIIEKLTIDKLIPYARNSRTHSDEQVAQIAASIKEFGFNNPVLIDESDGIIAGHGRVMAARKLGLSEVPCIRLSHLSETQRRAYVIADNKLAMNSRWDDDLLRDEIDSISKKLDVNLLGFNQNELSDLFVQFDDIKIDDEIKVDEIKKITVEHDGDPLDVSILIKEALAKVKDVKVIINE